MVTYYPDKETLELRAQVEALEKTLASLNNLCIQSEPIRESQSDFSSDYQTQANNLIRKNPKQRTKEIREAIISHLETNQGATRDELQNGYDKSSLRSNLSILVATEIIAIDKTTNPPKYYLNK